MNIISSINIEHETLSNTYFRKVIYTTSNQQLVVMSLKPLEDIPLEVHIDNDQFFRIESGSGEVEIYVNSQLNQRFLINDGFAFIVPKGTYHRIINTSDKTPLKLYTIYSPPHHPDNHIDIDKPPSIKEENLKETQVQHITRTLYLEYN